MNNMNDEKILIDWQDVNAGDGSRWGWTRALYAIQHPEKHELLYLGKTDGTTIRARWNADDKHERVWKRVEDEKRIFEHRLIVGQLCVPTVVRLTRELMIDVESLLIHQIKPWANTHCVKTRDLCRPGMVICCQGKWPLKRTTFRDER